MTMDQLMEIFEQSNIHNTYLLTHRALDGRMLLRGFDMYKLLDLINKTIESEGK